MAKPSLAFIPELPETLPAFPNPVTDGDASPLGDPTYRASAKTDGFLAQRAESESRDRDAASEKPQPEVRIVSSPELWSEGKQMQDSRNAGNISPRRPRSFRSFTRRLSLHDWRTIGDGTAATLTLISRSPVSVAAGDLDPLQVSGSRRSFRPLRQEPLPLPSPWQPPG